MYKAAVIALVAAGVAACGREVRRQTPPLDRQAADEVARRTELDRLWAYAPDAANIGLVMTGDALVMFDRLGSWITERAARPGGASAADIGPLREMLVGTTSGKPDVGIDLLRGTAAFITYEATILVLPVVDRDSFLGANDGKREPAFDRVRNLVCRQIRDRYVCASVVAGLEQLEVGGGNLGRLAGVAGTRGDVELVARRSLSVFRWPDYLVSGNLVTAVARIRRGEVVLRMHHAGQPHGALAALRDLPETESDLDHVSGFVMAPIHRFGGVAAWSGDASGPSIAALFDVFSGPFTFVVPSGGFEMDATIPVRDSAVARTMVAHCTRTSGRPAGVGDTCRIGPPAALPQLTAELWAEPGQLRLARVRGAPPATTTPRSLTAIGRELAQYPLAIWGRGLADPSLLMSTAPSSAAVPELNELGFGVRVTSSGVDLLLAVRTIAANPDDVAAKLEAAVTGPGDPIPAIDEIARSHPDAPIAGDVAAGRWGLSTAVYALSLLKMAYPALREYSMKLFIEEPQRVFDSAAAAARVHYVTHGKYPVGQTEWTSMESCCRHRNRICETDPAVWAKDPVWTALGVSVESPHRFLYQYTGTADHFMLRAEADLDCDGDRTTRMWITGTVENGGPALKQGRTDEPR